MKSAPIWLIEMDNEDLFYARLKRTRCTRLRWYAPSLGIAYL
jgi:hypothetical protein